MSFGTTDDIDLAPSLDENRVAFTAQTTQTRVWQLPFDNRTGRPTGAPEPVTPAYGQELDVVVSGDGRQLAYRAVRNGREEIWAYSLPERQERLLLATTTGRRTIPLWSPDGTQLLYARRSTDLTAPADHALAVLPALGGAERVLSVANKERFEPRDWASDGHTLVGGCQGDGGRFGTCLLSLEGGRIPSQVKVIADDQTMNLFCQRFSPDERWISFLAIKVADPTVSRVYIVPASGGKWTPVTDGLSFDDKPRWAPDGRILYFLSNRTGFLNVWGRHLDISSGTPTGEPFPVTSYQTSRFRLSPLLGKMGIAVSRDRLFLPIAERTSSIWILDYRPH